MVSNYINNLFTYVSKHYLSELVDHLNTPFGFAPSKRLKLIHGYDSFVDISSSHDNNDFHEEDEYNTLPFVLSEDLFIEFE